MTQYLLSVFHDGDFDPSSVSEDEMQATFAAVDVFNAELQASGAWVFAGGLHPPSSATVVRVVDGETMLTDGPYAETKEQVGGFWVIEAADLDAALALAAKGSVACANPVEVRPFQG
jgi:hypothetical protein